ncbi:MAG: CDP-glycerol glycerophosphotransferase family protein [Ancrocorticia sp.]|uniref:CDP-glycerol glycerophosphotransferase family protein n=1 Tax=Ancrocorticia sp. TaxID=2593684 RepID=UPI003F900178
MPESGLSVGSLALRLVPALRAVGQAGYSLLKKLPLRSRVVMMTRRDVAASVDFQEIEKYLARTFPDVDVVTLYHPMHNKVLYAFRIARQLYYLATSRWIITDSYQISISMFPIRSGVRVLQIWHALGAVKQFGKLTVGLADGASKQVASTMKMHENYDVVAAPSEATADVFSQAFGVDRDTVKVIGSPRIDFLVGADKPRAREEVARKYRLDPARPIYLYAPTFRDSAPVPIEELVAAFANTDAQLMLQIHPRDAKSVKDTPGVVLSREPELLDLLPGVDGVISDYSGAIFEVGILGTPLALWAYDEEQYRCSPGFTFDYDQELSDIITADPAEAIEFLESKRSIDSAQFERFLATYIETNDGNNCQRLATALGLTRERENAHDNS